MTTAQLLANFLSPPILFFLLGLSATLVRSDLELPSPLPKILSLYLLLAIGFKGGAELVQSGLSAQVALTLGAAILTALIVPVYSFYLLRLKLDVPNAAAIAATYGSVSAVTFITAVAFLDATKTPYSGHMVALLGPHGRRDGAHGIARDHHRRGLRPASVPLLRHRSHRLGTPPA